MRLDTEILDGPPETGARILALARLADAEDAAARLDSKDRGHVPGFVEALRRLESTLEALAPALAGAVTADHLRTLAAARAHAGPAREADLIAGWLQGVRAELAGPYRGALDWLADRIERRRRAAGEELAADATAPFRRLAPGLARELARRRAHPPRRAGAPETFARLLAGVIRVRTRALREALGAVAGAADAAGLERASADADRLLDLVEPLGGPEPSAAAAVAALEPLAAGIREWLDARAAQDALDGALLEARADEVRRGAAALAGLRPGLLAVLALAQRRAADRSRRIEAGHLAERRVPVTDGAYAVVAALEATAREEEATAAAGPERRFLVTAIPAEGRGGEVEEIEQGWLPGDGRESIGTVRGTQGERWFRERAAGRGAAPRVEPISRAEFEELWPLTEGRRVAKRRNAAPGLPGWRFDEYLDRPLVVAAAEVGGSEAAPPWLEPVLVREISGERGYMDEALARRPPRRAG